MPHLKPKARAPPGFDALKQADETGDIFVSKGDVDSESFNFGAQTLFEGGPERGFGDILSDSSPVEKLGILGLGSTSAVAFGNEQQLGLKGMRASTTEGNYLESWCLPFFSWSFV
jgi:hypothetical protein